MKSQNNLTHHIFVEGRVQSVGYRRFAQKNAQWLSLVGWTRNLPDGRVELMALGDSVSLEKFSEVLRKGPAFAQVRDLSVKIISIEASNLENPSEFLILADAEINYK